MHSCIHKTDIQEKTCPGYLMALLVDLGKSGISNAVVESSPEILNMVVSSLVHSLCGAQNLKVKIPAVHFCLTQFCKVYFPLA